MRHKSMQYSQFLHRPVLNLIEGSNFKYFKKACFLESVVSLKLLISAGCSFKTVTVYYLPHIQHVRVEESPPDLFTSSPLFGRWAIQFIQLNYSFKYPSSRQRRRSPLLMLVHL